MPALNSFSFVHLARCAFASALLLSGFGTGASAATEPKGSAEPPVLSITPGSERLKTPEFEPYEAEYGSAFGRFFNQVRKFSGEGGDKISVLNIIEMPKGVIVDHRIIDAATLRIENFTSPYFAWGKEQVIVRATSNEYSLVRAPIDGGEPIYKTGALDNNGYFDGLGFSPTMAALLPLDVGAKFQMPKDQPTKDGGILSQFSQYEVVGKEHLDLDSGVSCDCWIIQQKAGRGVIHKYWISREAPFLIRRHRDVGGKRDFVSDVISFRPLH